MRYLPAILIYSSFVIAELHNFFTDRIVNFHHPMPMAWAVKFTTDQIVWLVIATAMVLMTKYKNRENTLAAKVLLVWVVIDTVVFFYNYKTYLYGQTYIILCLIIIIVRKGRYIADKIRSYLP